MWTNTFVLEPRIPRILRGFGPYLATLALRNRLSEKPVQGELCGSAPVKLRPPSSQCSLTARWSYNLDQHVLAGG